MNIKSVALYVRVSTQEQAKEGYSIDEQLDRLHKYCEAHDWKFCKEYIDPGFSGATLGRPSITQLIKDVQSKKINLVLVYKLDRLSRSQKDTLYLIEDVFLANGADFISMTENFDTSTPFGKAMIGILSVFAQLEREQIKERMRMGKEGRAKEGKWHGGVKVPIGYRFENDMLVTDPYEAHIIKRIFYEYVNGASVVAIADGLKRDGLRSSYGEIGLTTIHFLLKNNVYCGIIKHGKEEFQGLHEALIDQATFEKAQEIHRKNKENPRYQNAFKPVTVLGGLLKCARCGDNMRIRFGWKRKDGTQKKYYGCAGRVEPKHRKNGGCDLPWLGIEDVQDAVFAEIRKLYLDPLPFIQMIRASRAPEPGSNTPDAETIVLKKRIEEIDRQIEKLVELYSMRKIDFNVITSRVDDLTAEKERLSQAVEEKNVVIEEKPRISTNETLEAIKKINLDDLTLENFLDKEDEEQVRQVLKILIDEILLDEDKIEIHWNF